MSLLREFGDKISIAGELFSFIWERKLWWMLPLVFVLVALGLLVGFGTATGDTLCTVASNVALVKLSRSLCSTPPLLTTDSTKGILYASRARSRALTFRTPFPSPGRFLPRRAATGSGCLRDRFFARMVFSCLVDADFLDTEQCMDP